MTGGMAMAMAMVHVAPRYRADHKPLKTVHVV